MYSFKDNFLQKISHKFKEEQRVQKTRKIQLPHFINFTSEYFSRITFFKNIWRNFKKNLRKKTKPSNKDMEQTMELNLFKNLFPSFYTTLFLKIFFQELFCLKNFPLNLGKRSSYHIKIGKCCWIKSSRKKNHSPFYTT